MIRSIAKKLLPRTLQTLIRNRRKEGARKDAIAHWKSKGSPLPPPHELKQQLILDYARKYKCDILVETGTYLGEMVEAQRGNFEKIYSVELGRDLWEKAVDRFAADKEIKILQGDSGKVLPEIVPLLNQRTLFWLDGHYSEGITALGDKQCPILEEIDAIFSANKLKHILLIDDARCFTGANDFPAVSELISSIKNKDANYSVQNMDDIIRVTV